MTRGLYWTPWSLITSEETSYSALASVLMGKLYLVNEHTDEKLTIAYRAVVVGQGKGLPAGLNWSKTSDPSGDVDNVIGVLGRRTFGWPAFPCYGYMLGMGASLGVVGS